MIGSLLSTADYALSLVLSDLVRLALWSVAAGAASMGVYFLVSPQKRLALIEKRAEEIRVKLREYEGDFSGAKQLLRENLQVSLHRVWMTLGPSLLAGLPVIVVLIWMDGQYANAFPQPGETITLSVEPAETAPGLRFEPASSGTWDEKDESHQIQWPAAEETLTVYDAAGRTVLTLPPSTPAGSVKKRTWWNALFADPGGYVPPESPVAAIRVGYPEREVLPFGPAWMRSWLFASILLVTVAAVGVKVAFKIK